MNFEEAIVKTREALNREGIFKTEDAGESWNKVLDDVADAIVTVHPTNPDIVYASSDVGEIFFSNDAGQNWKKINIEKIVRGA